MNPRSILLILAAGIGVLAVVLLTRSYLNGVGRQGQQVQVTQAAAPAKKVLVAARNLPAGTILKADDMAWQPWPENGVSELYFEVKKDKLADLNGQVLRAPVRARAPLTRGSLVSPNERGFLASALTPGMRAVAVKVSAVSGIGGFIFPGDRVDVILTHSIGGRQSRLPVSETVFQNVRVLALDQRANDNGGQAKLAKTVTLEVTPKMAEKVAMLEKIGSLSLSLRSLAHDTEGEDIDTPTPPVDVTTSMTLGSEISKFLPSLDPEKGKNASVIIRRAGKASKVSFGTKVQSDSKQPAGSKASDDQDTDDTDPSDDAADDSDQEEGGQ